MLDKIKMFISIIYIILIVLIFAYWDCFSRLDIPFLIDVVPGAGIILFLLTGVTASILTISKNYSRDNDNRDKMRSKL